MVKGLRSLERKLLYKIPKAVERHLKQALAVFADQIVASAEAFVGEDEGDLKNSIGWVWGKEVPAGTTAIGGISSRTDDDDLVVTVFAGDSSTIVTNKSGKRFQNARNQEYGTTNMKANPFFFVAYRLNKRRGKSRITRAITKGLKEGSR